MQSESDLNSSGRDELARLYKVCEDQQRKIENLRNQLSSFREKASLSNARGGILHDVSLVLLSHGNTDQLPNSILEIITQELGVNSCSLMLRHDDVLTVRAARGLPKDIESEAKRRKGEGISGLVLETEKGVWSTNVEEQPNLAKLRVGGGRYSTNSFISVPVTVEDRLIGVLNVSDKSDRCAFTEEDASFLEMMGRQVGILLENADIREKSRRLAMTDELTGLFNYRHFQGALAVEIERVRRYRGGSLSLVMSDIDHFKSYNDAYGHQEGDYVLKRVARVLRDEARKVDIPSRYGGEEFVVILPEVKKPDARVFAERVRKKIETLHKHDSKLPRQVTISSGIAEFPLDGDEQEQLIRNADQALYDAKAGGRNRTELYQRHTDPLL